MADDLRMALEEFLRKAEVQDPDFLRDGVRLLAQELMELEVSQHLGAERYERTGERRGHRNGTRERQWDTRVGTIELSVPRVLDNGYFPYMGESDSDHPSARESRDGRAAVLAPPVAKMLITPRR